MSSDVGETQFPVEEIWTAINALLEERPVVRSKDVAEAVGCTRETARVKLHELEEDGQLASIHSGASGVVWYRPEYDPRSLGLVSDPSVPEQTETDSGSAPAQTDDAPPSVPAQTGGERVMFFPSRREIVVDEPGEGTRSILSQTAHLVDSTGDGFLYKIDTADVWNSPYESFDELKEDLKQVVGPDRWDGGFESRIQDDWERARMFRLRTHEDGYTVLEAADRDVFENVAKRKLEHNDHYTQYVADTWKRFRDIQSTARLGLSATPVRESGDAKEIYTLIGPPVGTDWGRLFDEGWVEKPTVELFLVPWASSRAREKYRQAEGNQKLIEAASNPKKTEVVRGLLEEHAGQKALIFVDWLRQGQTLADALGISFISGETRHKDREEAYQALRDGDLEALIVSRVGDEGIDLPDAEIAILASTMGSSRAQTGQRAGRAMRPLGDAQVYVLLTKGSGEEDWGRESTGYLAEKGIDVTKREWSG